MRQMLSALSLVVALVWLAGCGGASTEIKPTDKPPEMTPEQKAQIDKSMEESYKRNKVQPPQPAAN